MDLQQKTLFSSFFKNSWRTKSLTLSPISFVFKSGLWRSLPCDSFSICLGRQMGCLPVLLSSLDFVSKTCPVCFQVIHFGSLLATQLSYYRCCWLPESWMLLNEARWSIGGVVFSFMGIAAEQNFFLNENTCSVTACSENWWSIGGKVSLSWAFM